MFSRLLPSLLRLLPLILLVSPLRAAPVSVVPVSERPTWVIVHGAWAGGWEWKAVGDRLIESGAIVYRPTHTGQGERRHLASAEVDLSTHIEDVVNVILWEDLHDVIILGHSYGGMVMTGVVDRVPDRIQKVIYLDAALPEEGENIHQTFGREGPSIPAADGFVFPGTYDPARPVPHIVPQSARTFDTPIHLANQEVARAIPTVYILTADDAEAPEKDGFHPSYLRAKARGWPVRVMEADHVPHMNQVEALVALLHEVADEE